METFPTNNGEDINQNEAHSEDSPMSFSEHMASREATLLQDAISGLGAQDRDLVLSIAGFSDRGELLDKVKKCKKEGYISRPELADSPLAYYELMIQGNDMQTDIDSGKQELALNLGESRYTFAPIPEDCGTRVRENMAATRAHAKLLTRTFIYTNSEYFKQQAVDSIIALQKVNNNYNGNAEEYVWDLIRDSQENEENQDSDAILSSIKIGAKIKSGNERIKELRIFYLENLEKGRQKI